jgi:hypothetical protein
MANSGAHKERRSKWQSGSVLGLVMEERSCYGFISVKRTCWGLEKVGVCVFSCWYDGGFERNDSAWEAVNCVIAVGKGGHLVMANMDGLEAMKKKVGWEKEVEDGGCLVELGLLEETTSGGYGDLIILQFFGLRERGLCGLLWRYGEAAVIGADLPSTVEENGWWLLICWEGDGKRSSRFSLNGEGTWWFFIRERDRLLLLFFSFDYQGKGSIFFVFLMWEMMAFS